MPEGVLCFASHLSVFSNDISKIDQHLGNAPQAFNDLALIGAALDLGTVMKGQWNLGQ